MERVVGMELQLPLHGVPNRFASIYHYFGVFSLSQGLVELLLGGPLASETAVCCMQCIHDGFTLTSAGRSFGGGPN